MGKAMVRQRFVSALVVAMACLDAAVASASQPSAAALETQAQAEFAKVGTAIRERLDREAAGDPIGAHIAARDAEAHRYRYLDIKRSIDRLRSPPLASPSVEASRNPFLPDASFLAPSASPTQGSPLMVRRQETVVGREYPAWDMYRPHEVRTRAGTESTAEHPESRAMSGVARAADMYSISGMKPTNDERTGAATDLSGSASPAEPPREPFLVYREPRF